MYVIISYCVLLCNANMSYADSGQVGRYENVLSATNCLFRSQLLFDLRNVINFKKFQESIDKVTTNVYY